MEEFIQAVREEHEWSDIPFKIDGVEGYLTLEFDRLEQEYQLVFEWSDFKERNMIVDSIPSPEEVGKWIILMKKGKFFGMEPVFTDQRKKWIQHIRKVILEDENKEPETCYVCMEDTYEYKTPCNHDICYSCFVKTLQRRTSSKRDFICGICRKRSELR